MTTSTHAVLVSLVERYDETGGPVTPGALADSLDRTEADLRRTVGRFCEVELAAREGEGYRPTVTARELLDAGIHLDETVALDVVEG
jgi:predicted transcriptional regulator